MAEMEKKVADVEKKSQKPEKKEKKKGKLKDSWRSIKESLSAIPQRGNISYACHNHYVVSMPILDLRKLPISENAFR